MPEITPSTPKKKLTVQIHALAEDYTQPGKRYRAQRGRTIATFMVADDFKVTVLLAPKVPITDFKEFKFISSDPAVMFNVATVLKEIARFAMKLRHAAADAAEAAK